MLEKSDILVMIKLIKLNFGYAFNGATEDELEAVIGLWYNNLKNYPKEVVSVAFNRVMAECTKQPSLADIVEQIKKIASAGQPTENDYWIELEKAVGRIRQTFYFGYVSYYSNGELVSPIEKAKEVFNGLSPVLQEYLGSWHTLKSLSELDTLEFEKNRFIKVLPNMQERVEIKSMLNYELIKSASLKPAENSSIMLEEKNKKS